MIELSCKAQLVRFILTYVIQALNYHHHYYHYYYHYHHPHNYYRSRYYYLMKFAKYEQQVAQNSSFLSKTSQAYFTGYGNLSFVLTYDFS